MTFKEHLEEAKVAVGINLTPKEFKAKLEKDNEEHKMAFELSGAYGQHELWANGNRIEAGSLKDVYNAWVKNRFNKKYKKSK